MMIIGFIKGFLRKCVVRIRRTYYFYCESHQGVRISNPDIVFEKVCEINPDEWIPCGHPEVYRFSRSYEGLYYYRSQSVLKLSNAVISDTSDIVETKEGVLWYKAEKDNFCVVVPGDRNLLKYNSERLVIRDYKITKRIESTVISLLGVHAHLWAHFVVQQLPKLYFAGEYGLLNEPISILCPAYKDTQLKEIISLYLEKYPKVNIIYAESGINYRCDQLLYIPPMVWLGDHSEYIHPSMGLFPPRVSALLKRNLVEPIISRCRESNKFNDYKKIYLVRRNEGYRHVENAQELEEAFSKMGFKLIAPHEYTFEEKVEIFYKADVIAGPLSGGFINIMFCHPGTKVLPFSQICRTTEGYLPFLQKISGVDLLLVTGEDRSSSTQCDVYFPVEKVIKAYHSLTVN